MMTGHMNTRGGLRKMFPQIITGRGSLAPAFGALALAGMLALAGCGGEPEKENSPPEGSSAAESRGKDGDHHHDSQAEALSAHTHTTRLEFSSEPAAIPVGQPATLTLKIVDQKSGEPVKEFDLVHDKLLHLIIVSADLSWFNHIHPEYKGDGVFTVTTTLPREGSYKLYADYTPKGGSQEVPQHLFATGGAQPAPSNVTPVADTLGEDDTWMIRRVTSAPEGEPGYKGGDSYEVALMPMPAKIVAGQDVMLHFQVRDMNGKPVAALEPYLGTTGHCVILSRDMTIYLHTHPMDGGDHGAHGAGTGTTAKKDSAAAGDAQPGSDVMFHTNFPTPGLYKVWGQFQHRGKIVTAAYVLNVEAAA